MGQDLEQIISITANRVDSTDANSNIRYSVGDHSYVFNYEVKQDVSTDDKKRALEQAFYLLQTAHEYNALPASLIYEISVADLPASQHTIDIIPAQKSTRKDQEEYIEIIAQRKNKGDSYLNEGIYHIKDEIFYLFETESEEDQQGIREERAADDFYDVLQQLEVFPQRIIFRRPAHEIEKSVLEVYATGDDEWRAKEELAYGI